MAPHLGVSVHSAPEVCLAHITSHPDYNHHLLKLATVLCTAPRKAHHVTCTRWVLVSSAQGASKAT